VDLDVWLEPTRGLSGKVLYEQFLEQADGHRLTMLTLDAVETDETDADEDDEEEMIRSWTPRHKR
jgi:hypothetical protein